MRIILSRKGFDSKYGAVPSPILPSGELCSLPIQEELVGRRSKRYEEIMVGNESLGKIVCDLTNGRIRPSDYAHFDPDLNSSSLPRKPQWRGLFGQTRTAESHLRKKGVAPGDVFLFFGWFRQVEFVDGIYRYVRNAPNLHVIFGWLQVELRITDGQLHQILDWASDHPHCRGVKRKMDSVYVAREKMIIPQRDTNVAGYGVFPCHATNLCLTAPGLSRRWWRLPTWFYPKDKSPCLSYHPNIKSWQRNEDSVLLKSAAIGQEFVLNCDHYPESIDWLMGLLADGAEGQCQL